MNVGFVSTRFAGTDGVSLESRKWAAILETKRHRTYWFSGLTDHPAEVSFVVPEAHFDHPDVLAVSNVIWKCDTIPEAAVAEIERLRALLDQKLAEFCDQFSIDLLLPQNAITIPMNLPLGLALADFIERNQFPTLAHHHDFYWERERFTGRGVQPYLDRAFPPNLPSIQHAVINSAAARELKTRFGLEASLVPNVMDFDAPVPEPDRCREELRTQIGLETGDRLILQPTRVVPRKGIEIAIELLHRLDDPRNKLIISHDAGDEGLEYRRDLESLAASKQVDLRFLSDLEARFSLEELYPVADFVTYPSLYEGFGNALLEAVYFKKPLLVNRYSVFRDDIEGCGLDLVLMDGEVTAEVTEQVRDLLNSPDSFREAAERNFQIARKYFGFETLSRKLTGILRTLKT